MTGVTFDNFNTCGSIIRNRRMTTYNADTWWLLTDNNHDYAWAHRVNAAQNEAYARMDQY